MASGLSIQKKDHLVITSGQFAQSCYKDIARFSFFYNAFFGAYSFDIMNLWNASHEMWGIYISQGNRDDIALAIFIVERGRLIAK